MRTDDTWCGQCYLDFRPRREAAQPKAPHFPLPPRPDLVDAAAREAAREASYDRVWAGPAPAKAPDDPDVGWPCPACGFSNPMSRDRCEVCATPFAMLFEEEEALRPMPEPQRAAAASLLFPGVGHVRCGRVAEGIARGVLFVWAFATGLVLTLVHLPASPLAAMGWLFFLAAAAIYGATALDAFRLASDDDQLLSPKLLMYGSAGLVGLSMISLFLLVFKVSGKIPHVPQITP
jgi:hypothetical protein